MVYYGRQARRVRRGRRVRLAVLLVVMSAAGAVVGLWMAWEFIGM